MNKSKLHNELLSKYNHLFDSTLIEESSTDIPPPPQPLKYPIVHKLQTNKKHTIIPVKDNSICVKRDNHDNHDKNHTINYKKYVKYSRCHILYFILFEIVLIGGLLALNSYLLIKYTNINYIN